MKKVGIVILSIIGLLVLAFMLELLGLEWTRFFKPRKQNVEREVFEQTKSYTHGKIQDLAKYYAEYQKADMEGKEQISEIIKMQFANFEAESVDNAKLRQFLINVRGF